LSRPFSHLDPSDCLLAADPSGRPKTDLPFANSTPGFELININLGRAIGRPEPAAALRVQGLRIDNGRCFLAPENVDFWQHRAGKKVEAAQLSPTVDGRWT
jgi:hypothetical protein